MTDAQGTPDPRVTAAEADALTKVETRASSASDGGQVAQRSSGTKKALFYTLLVLFALLYIFPFIIQLVTSFKTQTDASNNALSLIPHPFTTEAFERLQETPFFRWFFNSVWVTLIVTAARVFFCSLAGYALARLKFRGRGALFTAILAVMSVPGIVWVVERVGALHHRHRS